MSDYSSPSSSASPYGEGTTATKLWYIAIDAREIAQAALKLIHPTDMRELNVGALNIERGACRLAYSGFELNAATTAAHRAGLNINTHNSDVVSHPVDKAIAAQAEYFAGFHYDTIHSKAEEIVQLKIAADTAEANAALLHAEVPRRSDAEVPHVFQANLELGKAVGEKYINGVKNTSYITCEDAARIVDMTKEERVEFCKTFKGSF